MTDNSRNYFYCEGCANGSTRICVCCLKAVRRYRRNGSEPQHLEWGVVSAEMFEHFHSGLSTIHDEAPWSSMQNMTSGLQVTILDGLGAGRIMGSRAAANTWLDGAGLCSDCKIVLRDRGQIGQCTGCRAHFAMGRLTAVVAGVLGRAPILACRECAPSLRPAVCVRCGETGSANSMSYSNRHTGSRLCNGCTHKPIGMVREKERLTGFELEMLVPERDEVELGKWGRTHDDGSIRRLDSDVRPRADVHYIGREFASFPAGGKDLKEQIHAVMELVTKAGAYVNSSCGLHTHYMLKGSEKDELERIRWWWLALEPLIMMLVPSHRRANGYCKGLMNNSGMVADTKRMEQLVAYGWDDRYSALNLCAMGEHGTYEVRLFHATLDPKELWNWTQFMNALLDMAKITEPRELPGSRARDRLRELLMMCQMPMSVKKFLVQSAARHNVAPLHWKEHGLPTVMKPTMPEKKKKRTPEDISALWPVATQDQYAVPAAANATWLSGSSYRRVYDVPSTAQVSGLGEAFREEVLQQIVDVYPSDPWRVQVVPEPGTSWEGGNG